MLGNYKIKVDCAESSAEIQNLFFEMGCFWLPSQKEIANLDASFIYATEGVLTVGFNDFNFAESEHKELTLPQLRDLAVLNRNDVKDATHADKGVEKIYLTGDKVVYYWDGEWCESAINNSNNYENYIANSLKPIHPEQGLISGADALRALADGKEVEYLEVSEKWRDAKFLTANVLLTGDFSIRLKPQTIKVEIEIPKPFEPKEDCHVYILDDGKTDGYRRYSYEAHGDKGNAFIGIWRTEAEVKQVVAALRGALK